MNRSTVPLAVALAAAALFSVACGADDADTESTGSSPSTASTTPQQLEIDLLDCHQAGFPTGISPEAAGSRLAEGQVLFLDNEGQARFTLIAKHCGDIVVDDNSTGPGHFNTAWLRIQGPEETRTIEGSSDVVATPTDYFHPVTFQTDNEAFADATADFGVPMTLADSMTMGPAAAGRMVGSVEDSQSDPAFSYEWTMDNTNPFPPGTNGVVHVLSGLDDEGQPLNYDIECLVDGGWFANPTTLTVEDGSGLADLIGTGYSGVGPSPDLDCSVTITR